MRLVQVDKSLLLLPRPTKFFYNNFLVWVTFDQEGWAWQTLSTCESIKITGQRARTEAAALRQAKNYLIKFGSR
jgi:hypothetical protein